MTARPFDEVFRDFVINGIPASGPYSPYKPDIRDSLNALVAGPFPDNRIIKLNNADEGSANNIVVTAAVDIPAATYQVLYILNVTQENTGPVTVSGAINRALVTNTNRPVEAGYLQSGMALLCIDTGMELRLLSYGDAEAIQEAAEDAAARAEAAANSLNLPTIQPGDAGKSLVVNPDEDGYELGSPSSGAGEYESRAKVEETDIPETANFLRTAGYYAPGDGGGALYKRVATQPTHAGKVQSADGAWWEISKDEHNPLCFGAKADGSQDDAPAILGALQASRLANLPEGKFLISSQILIDNSTMAGETESGPKGFILRGQDARQTIIMAAPALTTRMLHLNYGLDASAHSMHHYSDFSLVGRSKAQKGIQINNAAFLHMDNVTVRGTGIALDMISTLSSSFKDMRLDANNYGVVATKGSGFSYPNALSFENCVFSNNAQLGYSGNSPTHNLNIIRGTVEGNGTQGDDATGGIFLNFEGGIEGAVGANINGVYFEGNGGSADLRLDNLAGSKYVTVIVQGCNFNRTQAAKFVRQNIVAVGRINLVLIGNSFRGYNDYVETSVRPYLFADSLVRVISIGNYIDNAAAGASLLSMGSLGTHRGVVASDGTGTRLPNNWSVAKAGTGVYTITHNLGDVNAYSLVAVSNTDSRRVQRTSKSASSCQVVVENLSSTLTDGGFDFVVTMG
ncbi:hypothetical protein J2782_001774 [Brucella pseudogrignonensis]|uniref:Pectate lyase superfamily protein domain-containing protein n=1 Tax=Brucella pseudogrignonensis TaxID=419475 RepID=A0ABU1M7L5_9HYPH|nr:hypothetical protein [Brucella pseudogrignonensis]